jgi:hypothetical protein
VKRLSLLVTLIAAGLLATMAVGAGTASATHLCKTIERWDQYPGDCKNEDVYPVGSKFVFTNIKNVSVTDEENFGYWSCKKSQLELTITDEGGGPTDRVEMAVTNITFGECFNGRTPVATTKGSAWVTDVSTESRDGRFTFHDTVLAGPTWAGNCSFNMSWAEGLLDAPDIGLEPKNLETRLTFNNAKIKAASGMCSPALFNGTYADFEDDIWTTYK